MLWINLPVIRVAILSPAEFLTETCFCCSLFIALYAVPSSDVYTPSVPCRHLVLQLLLHLHLLHHILSLLQLLLPPWPHLPVLPINADHEHRKNLRCVWLCLAVSL